MIILEGPDGAGKTTLLNQLKADLGLEVAPRVVSKDAQSMVDLQEWVRTNLNQGFQHTLFDRHRLISEPIYGPILRDTPEPGFSDMMWFHEALYRFYRIKPIVIYCLPPFESVWKNVMSSDDNQIFHDNERALRTIYFSYFNKAATEYVLRNRECWVYDYTSSHADITYRALLQNLKFQLSERMPHDTE